MSERARRVLWLMLVVLLVAPACGGKPAPKEPAHTDSVASDSTVIDGGAPTAEPGGHPKTHGPSASRRRAQATPPRAFRMLRS